MFKNYVSILVAILSFFIALPVIALPAKALDLESALEKAQGYYALQLEQSNIGVQSALLKQARTGINPRIVLGVEEFPSLTGQSGEFNLIWQQTWAISGRIARREAVAQQELALARSKLALRALQLRRDVSVTFFEALMHQRYLEELKRLLQSVIATRQLLEIQHREGKILRTEVNRARLMEQDIEIQKQSATLEWQQAKAQLSFFWNETGEQLPMLSESLDIESVQLPENVFSTLAQHPEVQRAEQILEKQRLNVSLQDALAWPDLVGNLGARYLPYENNVGSLASLNWPIPLVNTNQGNREAARQQIQQAELKKKAQFASLGNRLQQHLMTYRNAKALLHRYEQDILPAAQDNLKLNTVAYTAGKLPYLAVLDTQRSLINYRLGYIKTKGAYRKVVAQLEYFWLF